MEIPPFMLKKLFVKGSLKRTDNGVSFTLKNAIASAHLVGINTLEIGGISCAEKSCLKVGDKEVSRDNINPDNPLYFDVKDKADIIIKDVDLSDGKQEITIALQTKEVGPLTIKATDNLK